MQPIYAGPSDDPDRFELIGDGKAGGEGVTWQARYRGALTRPVTHAVKMLSRPESAAGLWPSRDDRRRWWDVKHLVQAARNPHLVQLDDFFFGPRPHPASTQGHETDAREHNTPYFVMEWIDGPSLEQNIRSGNPALPERLGYIRDLAEAIDSLHSETRTGDPMLHGDIKPGNCLIHPQRGLVLIDLGTLRQIGAGPDPLGRHTLHYTAPEVLRDPRKPRSPESDRYAVGAVAYFCLVGDDPPAASDLLTRRMMRAELTAAAGRLGASAPGALTDHILHMLQPGPRSRPRRCAPWADQASVSAVAGGRRRSRHWAAVGGLTAVAGAALGAGLILRHRLAPRLPTILDAVVLLACVLVVLWFVRGLGRGRAQRSAGGIADLLAAAVPSLWSAEVSNRRLYDPYPLPVSWDPAPDQADFWASLWTTVSGWRGHSRADPAGWADAPQDLAGGDDDLARVLLQQVPSRRVLLLGDAGAGKSMLLARLARDLLLSRRPGDPVPVLLALSSWNPEEQDLRGWLRERLSASYPTLVDRGSGGAGGGDGFDALLDAHKMILLLDGLDEVQPALRAAAVDRINRELEPGHVLVVSCRTENWPPGPAPLRYAAAIVLNDLEPAAVRQYLTADAEAEGEDQGKARWEGVFEARADSALAAALRTPLMVWLIRAIYGRPPGQGQAPRSEPKELCDTGRFLDQAKIEQHLLDGLIPAAYGPGREAQRADRWLRFLARHLDRAETVDLEWWQLRKAAPRFLSGIVSGCATGIAVGMATATGQHHNGAGVGAGLLAGLLAIAAVRRLPPLSRSLARAIAVGVAGGLLGGLGGGLARHLATAGHDSLTSGLIGGIEVGLALAATGRTRGAAFGGFVGGVVDALCAGRIPGWRAGIIDGIAVALTVGFLVEVGGRRPPARGLRGMRWSPVGLLAGCGVATAVGLTLAFKDHGVLLCVAAALVTGLAAAMVAGLESTEYELTQPRDPWTSFVLDLTTFAASGLSAAFAFGLAVGVGIDRGIGLADGFAFGVGGAFLQAAAGPFALAWLWLAATARLPWRFFGFLADAHRNRAVLRQAGAAYQFRHISLQRRLAGTNTDQPPAEAPG